MDQDISDPLVPITFDLLLELQQDASPKAAAPELNATAAPFTLHHKLLYLLLLLLIQEIQLQLLLKLLKFLCLLNKVLFLLFPYLKTRLILQGRVMIQKIRTCILSTTSLMIPMWRSLVMSPILEWPLTFLI